MAPTLLIFNCKLINVHNQKRLIFLGHPVSLTAKSLGLFMPLQLKTKHTYPSIFYWCWRIQRQILTWPWNLGYRSLKFIGNGTIPWTAYEFLFVFHCDYGHIFIFSQIKRYVYQKRQFSYPLPFDLHDHPKPLRNSFHNFDTKCPSPKANNWMNT